MYDIYSMMSDISDNESESESIFSTFSDSSFTTDFDEIIGQITLLQLSYDEALLKLEWIQDHIVETHPLEEILDKLHAESLKEIEETGQSSFGSKILAHLSHKN